MRLKIYEVCDIEIGNKNLKITLRIVERCPKFAKKRSRLLIRGLQTTVYVNALSAIARMSIVCIFAD